MTEAMVDDALVTGADREAAAALVPFCFGASELWQSNVRAGYYDDGKIVQAFARHRLAGVAAGREETQVEIVRLRGLLIDPGDPAWEDARAVLVAELRKAEMPDHAAQVADGQGAYVPSWIVLNLIAHAATAIRQRGE